MPLKRLSLCPCGYTLLREDIQIGTIYEVDAANRTPGRLTCGGCGRNHFVTLVYVARRGNSKGGCLPLESFQDLQRQPEATPHFAGGNAS